MKDVDLPRREPDPTCSKIEGVLLHLDSHQPCQSLWNLGQNIFFEVPGTISGPQ